MDRSRHPSAGEQAPKQGPEVPIPDDIDAAIEHLEDRFFNDMASLAETVPDPLAPNGQRIAHALGVAHALSTAEVISKLRESKVPAEQTDEKKTA